MNGPNHASSWPRSGGRSSSRSRRSALNRGAADRGRKRPEEELSSARGPRVDAKSARARRAPGRSAVMTGSLSAANSSRRSASPRLAQEGREDRERLGQLLVALRGRPEDPLRVRIRPRSWPWRSDRAPKTSPPSERGRHRLLLAVEQAQRRDRPRRRTGRAWRSRREVLRRGRAERRGLALHPRPGRRPGSADRRRGRSRRAGPSRRPEPPACRRPRAAARPRCEPGVSST